MICFSNRFDKNFLRGVKKKKANVNLSLLRTKGGGVKKFYRHIDLTFVLGLHLSYLFLGYFKDARRSAFLGLYIYFNGVLSLRIGSEKEILLDFYSAFNKRGDEGIEVKNGQIITLDKLRGGSFIHNLPFYFSSSSRLVRSAGMFTQLLRNDFVKGLSYIRVRRGFDIILPIMSLAIFGRICNKVHNEFNKGKAGIFRRLGLKPIVRGIAMNPVDHPNGGRTPGGKVYRSYTNKIARSFLKTNTKLLRKNKFIYIFKKLEI
jgi:large subunit ribosomal protein L2